MRGSAWGSSIISAALVGAVLVGVDPVAAGEAFEESFDRAFSFPLAPGSATLEVPQFDDAEGTRILERVSISIVAHLGAEVTGENDTSLPAPDFALSVAGFMTLDFQDLSITLGFTEMFPSGGVGPSDGVSGSGPDFFDFGAIETTAIGTDTTDADLGAFMGDGALPIDVFASGGFSISGTTHSTLDVAHFTADGTIRVTYRYAVLPGACCLPGGACNDGETPETCARQGGAYQGDGTPCGGLACPDPPGACCFGNGSCDELDLDACAASGGMFTSPSSTCDAVLCGGTCCFADGACSFGTLQECLPFGGVFQGPGVFCAPSPCPPTTGACCFPGGACTDGSITSCTVTGGIYQGTGTSCAAGDCVPQITGACCFPSGGCTQKTPEQCLADGGEYHGDDTACPLVECPAPWGACCLTDGVCTILEQLQCSAVGGFWQGASSQCATTLCPGACPSDINGSADVGFSDLLRVLTAWGPCLSCVEDLDDSGDVGFTDLLQVMVDWGPCL